MSKNNCCGGVSLPSTDNELELLVRQLRREVKNLMNTTEAKLLCQSKKIDETMVYIKNNLSNSIRDLLDSMENSGELDDLISNAVLNELALAISYEPISNEQINKQLVASDSITIETGRKYDTDYVLVKVKGLKPEMSFSNNSDTNPNENLMNVLNFMKVSDHMLGINAGLKGLTVKDGVSFINANASNNEGWYVLAIKSDGSFKCYPRNITGSEIISDGYKYATNIWSPLVQNGQKFSFSTIDNTDTNYQYIIEDSHPRQAIGRLYDGTYLIVTTEGRMVNQKGLTSYELQELMYDLGCIEAYNLDGGASTQTVMNKRLITRMLSESRKVWTIITFGNEVSYSEDSICN